MNGALAVAIVVIFAVLGDSWGSRVETTQSHAGALLGLIVGLVVAAIVCGLLAILISIEKSLKHIATHTKPLELPEQRGKSGTPTEADVL